MNHWIDLHVQCPIPPSLSPPLPHVDPFLSYQCKEIEENNRMGKTRDLFRKIRDTKGTFHAKIGSVKDRNGRDLTKAEDIKRGGKNTQNHTKKSFMTQKITMV